jgi:hypothetical protein
VLPAPDANNCIKRLQLKKLGDCTAPLSCVFIRNQKTMVLTVLLCLSRSRIRQLITLEEMPTVPEQAKLWYEANAKKNPSYKRCDSEGQPSIKKCCLLVMLA